MSRPRPLSLLVVAAAAATLVACSKPSEAARRVEIPVKVATVDRAAGPSGERYSATILPAVQVDVAFKATGYVEALAQVRNPDGTFRPIQEGDRVEPGMMLARVRSEDYAVKVASAVAAEAEARAAQVVAEADHKRTEFLFSQKAVSGSELDNQRARKDSAVAHTVGAQAHVAEARTALRDCVLTSPIDGVVVRKKIEIGSLVSGGTVAFTVADARKVKVVFASPDVLVNSVHPGSPVSIAVEAVGGSFHGAVTRVDPSADSRSRTFEIEATIPNADGALRPGMIASVALPGDLVRGESTASTLPLSALVRSTRDARGFAVFRLEGGEGPTRVALRDVRLGELVGDRVVVRDGLAQGDRVVTRGAALLRDGDPIRVIP